MDGWGKPVDLDKQYATLAGGGLADLGGTDTRLLLARAEKALGAATPEERKAGLEVAATIGGRDGMEVVAKFLRDPDSGVRRYAFNLAIAAGASGLPVVREAAADADETLASDAMKLLVALVDKASTRRARALLSSASPRLRAAAAELLGSAGGTSLRRELAALSTDPEPAVREAAAIALERISGKRPRATPHAWWDTTGRPPPTPDTPSAPPSESAPEQPLARAGVPAGVRPDPVDVLARIGGGSLAGEAAADAIREVGAAALVEVLRAWRSGGDPAVGRGTCRAAVIAGQASWVGKLRRLLGDRDATVRAEAVAAVGALGTGAAVVTPVALLLEDEDAAVRAAAVHALGALGKRLGRPDLVRQRLAPLSNDGSPDVRAAIDQALAMLGETPRIAVPLAARSASEADTRLGRPPGNAAGRRFPEDS